MNNNANRRKKLFAAQNGLCHWCGHPMELEHYRLTWTGRLKANALFATFEHLIPKRDGGKRGDNIVLAHAHCNKRRDDKSWNPATDYPGRSLRSEPVSLAAARAIK